MMLLDNKTVVVTGGTGSLGQRIVYRLLSGELGDPKKVIVFSRDEGKQHKMRLYYLSKTASTDEIIYSDFLQKLEFRVGNIRQYEDVCSALKCADVVIHAAALKQVPTCEYFPFQAIQTNCLGAYNIVRAIHENSLPVETVVGISTDKACAPINVMGMSKALQERIFISANIDCDNTRFVCVRYGNVLASRGSVVPMFYEQILRGGPVTITDPAMTRFLLSINSAVDACFKALCEAGRGEIYIPKLPSANILNVAKALIGDREIDINILGLRPGEKMHEIMISSAECRYTASRDNYYVVTPMLPELANEIQSDTVLEGEYSSMTAVVSLDDTINLLKQHDLLIKPSQSIADELLV